MALLETSPPGDSNSRPRLRWMPLALLLAVLSVLLVAGLHRLTTVDALLDMRDRFHSEIAAHKWIAMAVYFLVYVAIVATSLPGSVLLTVTAGLMFGWLAGGIVSIMAATAGAAIVFLVARTAIGETLVARAGQQAGKLRDGFCRDALSYMLFLRLVPIFPFVAVNVVPALLGVPFRTFLLGTFIGILPACFAYSSAGAGLDSTLRAARLEQAHCLALKAATECPLTWTLGSLATPELKIALLLLSILALLPIGLKAWRRRRGDQ